MDAAHHVVVGDASFRADPRVIFDGPALELLAGPVDPADLVLPIVSLRLCLRLWRSPLLLQLWGRRSPTPPHPESLPLQLAQVVATFSGSLAPANISVCGVPDAKLNSIDLGESSTAVSDAGAPWVAWSSSCIVLAIVCPPSI